MTYAPPSSPQSIGGVVDDALRLFRTSFGRCWLLAIIPGLILAVYEMAFPVAVQLHSVLSYSAALRAVMGSPRVVALDLVSLLLTLVFQGAVLVREIAVVRGDESFTLVRALATSVRRLPGMILGTVLFLLAVAGGLALLILLVAAHGLAVSLPDVIGFLALLVLGFWLWGRLQLWTAALFVENARATAALGSSWRLTKDRWWRAATIFTVAVIIVLVFTVVFSFVGGLVAALSHTSLMGRAAVLQLFTLGSHAIAYPLDAAIWLAMYHDFKLRREGGDLAARAGALGSAA